MFCLGHFDGFFFWGSFHDFFDRFCMILSVKLEYPFFFFFFFFLIELLCSAERSVSEGGAEVGFAR